jgi:hypothetical protein
MKIKYSPLFSSFPPLERLKPSISADDRQAARLSPPPALPQHCKPWVDANSYGLLIRFPYKVRLSLSIDSSGSTVVTFKPAGAQLVYKKIVQTSFSRTHFGLDCGYLFKTDPGIGLYTGTLPSGYEQKGRLLPGLVETWWYPKNLFLVHALPSPRETLVFEEGDPLCVLMPVLCENIEGELMTPEEVLETTERRSAMSRYLEHHPELRWTSAEGETFSHIYKVFSKNYRTDTAVRTDADQSSAELP